MVARNDGCCRQGDIDRGVLFGEILEARVRWSLPGRIVIGEIRDPHEQQASIWVISGNVPTDYVGTDAATTPRDAARHFAMKWQLDAARYKDPSVQQELGPGHSASWERMGESLALTAEALFELVEEDRFWHGPQS